MRLFSILAAFLFSAAAFAAEPDELLDDPALEARAEKIDAHLRCVVCQSQSIAESNAPLAKDLRILVRERIAMGESDEEVMDYIVERYGDYVLLKPPVQGNTLFLWGFPAAALLLGAAGAFFFLRGSKKPAAASAPLSEDDEDAVNRILDERG
ncbi:cytochrome c-type biogenesis protein [Hyphococcus luteus]|uniref:Cytochrome c-type biogenesis protein n=1 Tax=Hyphococcus luteus TaxID=2058213 RepID=A0A2S7K2X8_9PROT|nr:cytochrome c-type biogenesis protein [Marinicaulis flavus]PQA86860.1 cytochrome c-type biogenesis protein CcmH [Marinicaulis flavus]